MLHRLHIRNFILVDNLDLEWRPGLTALTGETGAGKSILLTALGLLLGDRADSAIVRVGSDRAELTAEFTCPPELQTWLDTQDLANDEDTLLLRRVIDSQGKSRAYVNGSSVTLQQLKEIGEFLVDIHGQHAHQLLLRPEHQQRLLDHFAGITAQTSRLRTLYQDYRHAETAREAAQTQATQNLAEQERLGAQLAELEQLRLNPEEWTTLNHEQNRLAHAASLLEAVQTSLELLSQSEQAAQTTINQALQRIQSVAAYDPAIQEIVGLLDSTAIQLQESVSQLNHYLDHIELDPEALAQTEARISQIFSLARKYRKTPEELPDFLEQLKIQLEELQATSDLNALEETVQKTRTAYQSLAAEISQQRQQAATQLTSKVTQLMQNLGMPDARLAVQLEPVAQPAPSGAERVTLQIASHANATLQPLAKVASGGELSRISLALEVGALEANPVETLIFDEVDVGIGGSVAETVGRLLRKLGETRQVLCVTHLPQVAACAHQQIQVSKSSSEQGVVSKIQNLDHTARIEEIARMLGGIEVTATTRAHAKELLLQQSKP